VPRPVRDPLPRTDRLAGQLDGVANATVAVKEWEGEVIFLHEVHEAPPTGPTGCRWRKLAGLPNP
jgi:DNA mismatch repair protein MutS